MSAVSSATDLDRKRLRSSYGHTRRWLASPGGTAGREYDEYDEYDVGFTLIVLKVCHFLGA